MSAPRSHRIAIVVVLFAIFAGLAHHAAALIVAPPGANSNTSAPADDPGWLNVGNNGVYLGNRWVLTANHVGAGATNFPGVGSFAYESGSAVRLTNPALPGYSALTDLLLYRLTADPGLPALSIAATTPGIGVPVTLIGDGGAVTPSANETHWDITGTSPNFTWTEVPLGGVAHGYKSTTSIKLWGTNIIENDALFFPQLNSDHTIKVNTGHGDVVSLMTEFDNALYTFGPTTASEAQALGGDSGSGVFAKNGANWELVGITHAIGIYEDQPNVGASAVYGNFTYFADLSQYRNEILAITAVPELGSLFLVSAVAMLAGVVRLARRRP